MRRRRLAITAAARDDLRAAWHLVANNDGIQRADALRARILVFLRSLEEFAGVGTPHPRMHPGLRSTGVPGLKKATVLFIVAGDHVIVVRISYLGQNVWSDIPSP